MKPINYGVPNYRNWPHVNGALGAGAHDVKCSLPVLVHRLRGVPVCPADCRVQHPIVTVGGNQFRHITVGYGRTEDMAHTVGYVHSGDGVYRLFIVMNPKTRGSPRNQLRTILAHELTHAGDWINGCPHEEAHCACFHQVARALNSSQNVGVRVLQACETMQT
ncbi:hypothetical protein AAVH_43690 [Aphelenchoides avenae]|nr:hypothetical protein AAVH_43690 [Aphelenchus avenae]